MHYSKYYRIFSSCLDLCLLLLWPVLWKNIFVYLQLQSCHSNKCVGRWVVGLTKRLDEIWPGLETFGDNSSKIFPDYIFFFLSYNCIFSPIIWSINFITGGLVPLMNKIHHSYLVWGIFLMWWLHDLHKGIASFSPPRSSLLGDQSSLFFFYDIKSGFWRMPNKNVIGWMDGGNSFTGV